MVDDGVSFQSGDLGSDVLQTELEPLVEGDDTSVLQVHLVEHVLECFLLFRGTGVDAAALRDVALDQLEERGLADETVPDEDRDLKTF